VSSLKAARHVYAIRPRKDKYGVDLLSDVVPFGQLWYTKPDDTVSYAKFFSRSHDAVIRVYDDADNVIETHEHEGNCFGWLTGLAIVQHRLGCGFVNSPPPRAQAPLPHRGRGHGQQRRGAPICARRRNSLCCFFLCDARGRIMITRIRTLMVSSLHTEWGVPHRKRECIARSIRLNGKWLFRHSALRRGQKTLNKDMEFRLGSYISAGLG
jgi:hypothetical protein